MQFRLLALLAFLAAAPAQAQMVLPLTTIDGKVGCVQGMTGIGRPPGWQALRDEQAPGGWALVETTRDSTDLHFPFCLFPDAATRDFDATLRFKPVSGSRDRAGGLIFRAQDATDYFVARASALDGTVKLYRMLGGRRSQIASKEARITTGHWHTMRVRAAGKSMEVFLDGTSLITYDEPGLVRAGAIGVWSSSDSVTHFGSLLISPP